MSASHSRRPLRDSKGPARRLSPVESSVAPEAHPRTIAIPAATILPLRLFLGLTFIYAGFQKINDPGFLQPGRSTYIGSQMLAFSHGSPIRVILLRLMEHAVAIGLLTLVTEIVIGVLVLLGLFTRPAALIGLVLSLTFFLSASWHTYPYFLGSDIVFVMAWLTLALTGPGLYALDTRMQPRLWAAIEGRHPVLKNPLVRAASMNYADEPARPGTVLTRAEVLVASAGALVLVVLGLTPRRGTSSQLGGVAAGPTPASGPAATPAPTSGSSGAFTPPAGARKIGNVSQLPVNSAGTVSDPATGDPVVVVHTPDKKLVAYDAVCTHAGCTVEYDSQQHLLVCPCHGGTFDPTHGAQVVAGPPPTPLSPIKMAIDPKGNIYIV